MGLSLSHWNGRHKNAFGSQLLSFVLCGEVGHVAVCPPSLLSLELAVLCSEILQR